MTEIPYGNCLNCKKELDGINLFYCSDKCYHEDTKKDVCDKLIYEAQQENALERRE